MRVARLRAIFRIPPHCNHALFGAHGVSAPGHLAFVEWFSKPTAKHRDHQMYTVTRSGTRSAPSVSIIEVSTIKRGCQLAPMFGDRANRAWTSQNVLDRCDKFLLNNFVDHHTYQSVW